MPVTKKIQLLAPAKLNLFLHIVGQRADGYHLLQSVFQLIDWFDLITLEVVADQQIERLTPLPGVVAADDLTIKAAQLIKTFSGVQAGVAISLEKNIPIGAGLGGGSSDAAAVLLGLNYLWDLNLDLSTLMQLGLKLGADVPFFLLGKNAFVEGIGEQLQEIELLPKAYLVIFPGRAIPTATIFHAPQLTRDHAPITINDYLDGPLSENIFSNDCQTVAIQICPEVQQALDWIAQMLPCSKPSMSGSGSSVFFALAYVLAKERANQLCRQLPKGWVGRVVQGLNQNSAYNSISSK
jgi:4-diphosphocytidyl-2-C-methyl-D-erythritol kinase